MSKRDGQAFRTFPRLQESILFLLDEHEGERVRLRATQCRAAAALVKLGFAEHRGKLEGSHAFAITKAGSAHAEVLRLRQRRQEGGRLQDG